jgi:hypothetical protein
MSSFSYVLLLIEYEARCIGESHFQLGRTPAKGGAMMFLLPLFLAILLALESLQNFLID